MAQSFSQQILLEEQKFIDIQKKILTVTKQLRTIGNFIQDTYVKVKENYIEYHAYKINNNQQSNVNSSDFSKLIKITEKYKKEINKELLKISTKSAEANYILTSIYKLLQDTKMVDNNITMASGDNYLDIMKKDRLYTRRNILIGKTNQETNKLNDIVIGFASTIENILVGLLFYPEKNKLAKPIDLINQFTEISKYLMHSKTQYDINFNTVSNFIIQRQKRAASKYTDIATDQHINVKLELDTDKFLNTLKNEFSIFNQMNYTTNPGDSSSGFNQGSPPGENQGSPPGENQGSPSGENQGSPTGFENQGPDNQRLEDQESQEIEFEDEDVQIESPRSERTDQYEATTSDETTFGQYQDRVLQVERNKFARPLIAPYPREKITYIQPNNGYSTESTIRSEINEDSTQSISD